MGLFKDALQHLGETPPFRRRPLSIHETVQEHVYNTTVPATCLPHTGFAGVWTPATHAEFSNGTGPYINTALGVRVGLIPHTVPHRDGFLDILRHVLELVDLQTMWISLPSFTNHSF